MKKATNGPTATIIRPAYGPSFGIGLALLLIGTFAPLGSIAQAGKAPTLPSDAQEAVKKGIIAAKEQDYLLATRYFQDARKIAPGAPEIYYDLGLAESKIPGRELRAICWFEAYLAATPNASNAAAVKDQVDALDIMSQSNLSRLIQSIQDAAIKIPIETEGRTTPYTYRLDAGLSEVASLWEGIGDFTAAKSTISLMPPTGYDVGEKESAEQNLGKAQVQFAADKAIEKAEAGDFVGAQKAADLLPDNDWWKKEVDDGELSDPVYLNFANNVKSISSENPSNYIDALTRSVWELVKRQNDVDKMLYLQAAQRALLARTEK